VRISSLELEGIASLLLGAKAQKPLSFARM
jgi:hypothetical protein